MTSEQHSPTLSDQRQQLTDRLLDEGTHLLVAAAKEAGTRPVPCLRTLMRAAMSGKLEAIKLQCRWVTSAAAIRRWIARNQSLASQNIPRSSSIVRTMPGSTSRDR